MTSQVPARSGERPAHVAAGSTAALLRAALDAATEAVVLCATAGDSVLLVNAAAAALVPGLEPGSSIAGVPVPGLATAAARGADTFAGTYRGRHLRGRRRRLDDEHYAWYLRDATEDVEQADALRTERDRTAFLAEAGRRLSSSLHRRICLRTTVELAASRLADAAVVVLPADQRHSAWMRLVAGGTVEEGRLRERRLAEVPGLVEALGGFPPIPSRWLDATQAPAWLLPGDFGTIGALLVTPLPGNAEPAGALVLARRGPGAVFTPDDEVLARVFAARAGAALSAAALYRDQADTAAILQADLLPPELPQPDGVELAGSYQAAREPLAVGGDFYDVFGPTRHSPETFVALGDVCGKGPEAAVLTGKVRQTLRALRLVETSPEGMLHVLNEALTLSGQRHRFVTLVIGAISRGEYGRVRLRLATGGHPPPLVLRADGRVEEAPISGTLIGAVARTVVRPATIELAPGELCLLYSDGLTEARGGPSGVEQYGEPRLHDALATCRGMLGSAAVERVRQLVSDWVHGGTHDDIAMLAVRAPARTPPHPRGGGAPAPSPSALRARAGDERAHRS